MLSSKFEYFLPSNFSNVEYLDNSIIEDANESTRIRYISLKSSNRLKTRFGSIPKTACKYTNPFLFHKTKLKNIRACI